MAIKTIDDTLLTGIANAIRAKNGSSDTYKVSQMADAIEGINTVEHIEWHQCPELPRNFIAEVTYDPSDYTVSRITDYAPEYGTVSNYKPIGQTFGDKTFYNEVPNTETEFVSDDTYGTLKPLDQVRYINTTDAPNVRDLGGWACDGGTVKYGLLYRGGEPTANDRAVLVDELGVRHDLNLRGASEATWDVSPLGEDVYFTKADDYNWYSITNKEAWKINLRCVFDAVIHNEPVYFHCAAGADRTATLACILEAILGVSQSDMDKDYELTSFYSGTYSDAAARRRNEDDWTGLINQITSLSIGETFRDKVLNWVASLGFTSDEINNFRAAMIDGVPDTIALSIGTQTVTNTLMNVTSDKNDDSVTKYQPYEANIKAMNGYAIESIKVVMGGIDITSSAFSGNRTNLNRAVSTVLTNCTINNTKKAVIDGQGYGATLTADVGYTLDNGIVTITMGGIDMSEFYSGGKIAIPNVTGDIVITATAVASAPSYTNLADPSSSDWVADARLNSSGGTTAASGVTTTNFIPIEAGQTVRIKGINLTGYNTSLYNSNKSIVSATKFALQGVYFNDISASETGGIGTYIYSYSGFVRFSGVLNGNAEDVIITIDEPID